MEGLDCSMLIRPIVLDSISVSLTGIPVLHSGGTRRIAVGRAY